MELIQFEQTNKYISLSPYLSISLRCVSATLRCLPGGAGCVVLSVSWISASLNVASSLQSICLELIASVWNRSVWMSVYATQEYIITLWSVIKPVSHCEFTHNCLRCLECFKVMLPERAGWAVRSWRYCAAVADRMPNTLKNTFLFSFFFQNFSLFCFSFSLDTRLPFLFASVCPHEYQLPHIWLSQTICDRLGRWAISSYQLPFRLVLIQICIVFHYMHPLFPVIKNALYIS